MCKDETKAVLLRLPNIQLDKLEDIRKDKALKNIQALIYRIIEKELEKVENN